MNSNSVIITPVIEKSFSFIKFSDYSIAYHLYMNAAMDNLFHLKMLRPRRKPVD